MTENNEISEDDILLWHAVTANVKKLKSKNAKIKQIQPSKPKIQLKPNTEVIRSVLPPKTHTHYLKIDDHAHLDTKRLKQMNRGEMTVDAILDLHSLTEFQAFDKLVMFVQRSFASSFRLILVITGKGTEKQPGVLKGKMDSWINTSEIAPFVLRFARAAKKHGGEGAFYLYLKKNGAGCRI